ncbi:MAG: hypothetical protein HYW78_01695 [Parcubacteria group bacterium]|nr:hypothetical protein [Parcubacteria group bacterium]
MKKIGRIILSSMTAVAISVFIYTILGNFFISLAIGAFSGGVLIALLLKSMNTRIQ